MNYAIKKLDEATICFLPHMHQPFDVIGRLIPMYDGKKWSYREVLCDEHRQKRYEDDRIVPEDYLGDDKRVMFLAVSNDVCVGSIRVGTNWCGNGVIEDLAVDAQYRQMGIGKKLMDSAVAWCRDHRIDTITLETQDNNLQACRFYLKYGFTLCGINTQKYVSFAKYKDETALYFSLGNLRSE